MKILAIGNSFSQDATRYLYQIAKSNGDDFTVVNLYIGGCTLEMHYNNLKENLSAYQLQLNGEVTDKYISIKDALLLLCNKAVTSPFYTKSSRRIYLRLLTL